MSFKPCIVLPCYNHGYALEAILADIATYKLPALIVNDSSTDDTPTIIQTLRTRYPEVSVLHRTCNGGKGAAVRDGLVWASERGFSHALLLDSDGQHATGDIPCFLESARQSPQSIVVGRPYFGSEAPVSRRLGREVSNLFVALVTATLSVRDVLCGFRVYPLAVVRKRIQLERLQPRMGFDVEILVRALWMGISIVNVRTRVTYPVKGVSHFKYGADNACLAWLYTKLVFEGLYRVPARWLRRLRHQQGESREWHQITERGSLQGLRALLFVLEKVGRGPLTIILVPVVLHMFVWGRVARNSAIEFQKHIASLRGEALSLSGSYARSLRQFWEFGVSIVEKVVSWREGVPLEKFEWVGRDEVRQTLATGSGLIFIGAHVGNVEVIRALGETRQVVVNALMFTANSRHFRALLEGVNSKAYLRVIDISSMDPSLVFELQERLRQGEIVALLADRAPKHSAARVLRVPFLRREAEFPEGPWVLASFLEAPVFTVFSMRQKGGRYRVEFARLADRVLLPRATRAEALYGYIAEYARRLGDIALRYPYQWFNFYPFWEREMGTARASAGEPSPTAAPEPGR